MNDITQAVQATAHSMRMTGDGRPYAMYPKTEFKQRYGVTPGVLRMLTDAGVVKCSEHTPDGGRKAVTYYGWRDGACRNQYRRLKPLVTSMGRGYAHMESKQDKDDTMLDMRLIFGSGKNVLR